MLCSYLKSVALIMGMLVLMSCSKSSDIDYSGPVDGWPQAGASRGGGHFSEVTQITKENVGSLEIAWQHRSGDFE